MEQNEEGDKGAEVQGDPVAALKGVRRDTLDSFYLTRVAVPTPYSPHAKACTY